MKMTKHTWVTLAVLAGALISQPLTQAADTKTAQPAAGAPAGPARERLQEALKDLDLTGEQKEKLKPVFQEQMEKMRTLRQDKNLTPEQKMEKFKALREELSPKIKKVLTPEQYDKWEKAQAQRIEKGRDRWQQRQQQ